MGKMTMNLQDSFLNAARRQNVKVTIALNDGTKLKGKVSGFDNFTVILESDKIQHLVYKHAITSISPDRPLERHQAVPSEAPGKTVPVVAPTPAKSNATATPADLEKFKVAMESK